MNDSGRTWQPEDTPQIVIQPEPGEYSTRLELFVGDRPVSSAWISHFTMRVGAATIRMDGLGALRTDPDFRRRGYARRLMEVALAHMRQGGAVLAMLYGIRDFYPRFDFVTAGPNHLVFLTDLQRHQSLRTGWDIRTYTDADFDSVREIYDRSTAHATGAAVRPIDGGAWSELRKTATSGNEDDCRVAVGPDGLVHGYLWRAGSCWYVHSDLEKLYPNAFVIGEAMADRADAADAVLAACRRWATERQRTSTSEQPDCVLLSLPPEGSVAAAASLQDARFVREFASCGSSMARVLDTARLLEALRPELEVRRNTASRPVVGTLVFRTDLGDATLTFSEEGVDVKSGGGVLAQEGAMLVRLPQTTLTRLVLGAAAPGELLSRLPEPPSEPVARVLTTLFPARIAHMYLPDRY